MAFDVKKDIFEPTQKAIDNMNSKHVCGYCKTSVGFSNHKCINCGAPENKPVSKAPEPFNKSSEPRPAGPGRIVGLNCKIESEDIWWTKIKKFTNSTGPK